MPAAPIGVIFETAPQDDRDGALPESPRAAGGRRRYENNDLRRLSLLRRRRKPGFLIDEI